MADGPKGPWSEDERHDLPPLEEVSEEGGREPFFNMPGGVLVALALLFLIFAIQDWIVSPALSEWIVLEFGFSPIRYAYPLAQQDLAWIWTPLTYSLLHGGVQHLLFNGLWLAVFGTPVFRRIGAIRFCLLWLVTAVGGAALHMLLNWGDATLLVGSSAVIAGMMGCACRFAFGAGRHAFRFADDVRFLRRFGILEALKIRMVVTFILVFGVSNLIFAVGPPIFGDPGGPIAWDAHLGGFLVGFLGFAAFDRDAPR
ncbi:rhomboid family intramembrane serine protease [Rhizobium paknamense]|uniref:Membrane associated rhomboid family serine protease n=1 Tax=Rhizobium paknamense TaxID=1206817 RepID=A0ABU0ICL6_9HYPH|nr:rhomboid family intramembrane serine protease [Rhizobium paknamense]MDQ0455982.1 membrane associated rhomboid family serine protease [Rhizobium paknamense]